MKIAAICVLFNPDIDQVRCNINLILEQVEQIWLIDNSDCPSTIMNYYNQISGKVHYIWLGENKGIAFALNVGCLEALKNGFKWVLTMDQDSKIPVNCIKEYKQTIAEYPEFKIGIVTCKIQLGNNDYRKIKSSGRIQEVDSCWTSGSLMNLEAYSYTQGFKNDLFIDGVDIAYSLDLKDHGYHILKNSNIILLHQLGKTKSYNCGKYHLFYITNHNYIRRYYITRNYLWINHIYGNKYPFCKVGPLYFIKTITQILFFEADKWRKLRFMVRGYLDFKNGIFGKLK